MAYLIGTANSLQDLKLALEANLESNGWEWEGTSLRKRGLHVGLEIIGNGVSTGSRLHITVGNNAQDIAPVKPWIGPYLGLTGKPSSWEWPVTYHLHISDSPLEVYLMVSYGDFFQMLSFGQSPSPGNAGTGNWVHGSVGSDPSTTTAKTYAEDAYSLDKTGIICRGNYGYYLSSCAPFFKKGTSLEIGAFGSSMHGIIKGDSSVGWINPSSSFDYAPNLDGASSAQTLVPLLDCALNSWNSETVLLPCQVFHRRAGNKVSLVGELRNLRFIRNDYLPDGEVIDLGGERWKVYPFYRRNPSDRDVKTIPRNHSGTFGIAIKYDGS